MTRPPWYNHPTARIPKRTTKGPAVVVMCGRSDVEITTGEHDPYRACMRAIVIARDKGFDPDVAVCDDTIVFAVVVDGQPILSSAFKERLIVDEIVEIEDD